jgi:hypothetical protein
VSTTTYGDFAREDQDESGILYICGESCSGIKPTASDPLAQFKCSLCDPHCRVQGKQTSRCYRPREIDQHVVDEINLNERIDSLEQMVDTMTSMGGYKDETEEGPEDEEARVRWLQDTHEQGNRVAQG